MKATPLLISWHNESQPVYAADFEKHGKGRLATAGGDNNVRLWKIEASGEDRKVVYLSTLVKHTQAVNVVRWCPRGELLGSAGDDGNVLLWVPAENQTQGNFGENGLEDKETWRVRHMCRSSGAEIYDLAWSPDGVFFITGSMDNVARIYNASTGQCVRQIAEHNHYVQGVAWDPLNEYVATQSSDRSVHIYTLKTKDGQFTLAQHSKVTKMDLPARRISTSSPAPPDFGRASFASEGVGSPVPSMPGTPNSLALPMNPPPPTTHSRRSSFSSSVSRQRSVSPAPSSLPLPAVMPSTSPNLHAGLGVRNTNIYHNETLTSFFRRLTFTPDGSLLFTPAGQYKTSTPSTSDPNKTTDNVIHTVFIYTRAGLNKPPIAYLPGHKKASVAVRCSPVYYTLRQASTPTKQITIDTSAEEEISALPEAAIPTKTTPSQSAMDPPPFTSAPSPAASMTAPSPKTVDADSTPKACPAPPIGPPPAFDLPYRIVYAVATQDAVHIYDTQQQKPICVVSNLHFATFTDLAWSSDGQTLIITSSDGFCSALSFQAGELGQVYHPLPPAGTPSQSTRHQPAAINTAAAGPGSTQSTPTPTPTQATTPQVSRPSPSPASSTPAAKFPASPSTFAPARPASPTRSMSTSSVATQSSYIPTAGDPNPLVPAMSAVPSLGVPGTMPLWTPPQTPMSGNQGSTVSAGGSMSRRESESEEKTNGSTHSATKREADAVEGEREGKRRRIAPTLVSDTTDGDESAA